MMFYIESITISFITYDGLHRDLYHYLHLMYIYRYRYIGRLRSG